MHVCHLLSHHAVVWGILSLLCVFFVCFFCTVTDFSAAEKDRGVKFCMLAYYPDRSFSLLVKFSSRGVTGVALLSGMPAATEWISCNGMH